jgi:hypothetical protein
VMPLYTGQLNGDLINLGVFGLKSVTLRTAQGRALCNTQYIQGAQLLPNA